MFQSTSMDGPQGVASLENAPIGSSGGVAGSIVSGDGHTEYWCYQCNKVVVVRVAGGLEQGSRRILCAECRNGFVEILATAEPERPRGLRRRWSRRMTRGQMVELIENLEHLYPHQLTLPMQVVNEATRSVNTNHPDADENDDVDSNPSNLIRHRQATPDSWEDRADESVTVFQSHPGHSEPGISTEDSFIPPSEADHRASPSGHNFSDEGNSQRLILLGQISQMYMGDDGENDEGYGDDYSDEEGLQLELQDWHSGSENAERDEWEEVENDRDVYEPEDADDEFYYTQMQEELITDRGTEITVVTDNDATVEGRARQSERDEPNRHRRHRLQGNDRQILPARATNFEQEAYQYLLELLQNMVDQDVEVGGEFRDSMMDVGNPGDYVVAREFERLLQQLAENDGSQQGAPPAAKSVVDALPSVLIERFHLDGETAVCAICKETITINEYAKQLPCNHLYHHECILPWLNDRNSCPVCRYELPTDDPDYEEQRRKRDVGRFPPVRTYDESSEGTSNFADLGQETTSEGNEEVSELNFDRSGIHTELLDVSNSENPIIMEGPEIEHTDSGFTATPLHTHSAVPWMSGSWFSLIAGPVLSMVGLAFMICLGSHVTGSSGLHPIGRPVRFQQSNFVEEIRIQQNGSSVQKRRRWWMPFQR